MASLVKLKQIENGTGIASAVALAHPEATLTNNAAPFSFDVPTQVGNIPQLGAVSVSGNILTYTPGDGSTPVTYTPTFAADVFIRSGAYNATTGNLELTLNDATVVIVPLSALVPVATTDSQTIDFAGDGTNANPITGQVIFSATANNLAANDGTGVLVALASANGNGTAVSGSGTVASPLSVAVVADPAAGNAVVVGPNGVFVPQAVPTVVETTETVQVAGTGAIGDLFKLHVKLQPDGEGTVNFLHAASGLEQDDATQLGLGYTQGVAYFQGVGPFDLAAQVSQFTSGWSGTPEIVRVDGYINGFYYATLDGWDYSNLAAVSWLGTGAGYLFDLEASDELRFVLHIRAV